MKHFIVVLIAIVLGPVHALVLAGTLSKLWGWFCAAQYGSGPSYSSWFGLSLVAGVVLLGALSSLKRETDHGVATPLLRLAALWIIYGLVLATSWLTGLMTGWIAS